MSKNIYGYAFLAIVAVAAIHYFFFHNPCQEPSDSKMAIIEFNCLASSMKEPISEFRERVCKHLNRTTDCDLSPSDIPDILKLMSVERKSCIKSALVKENLCINKVKEEY